MVYRKLVLVEGLRQVGVPRQESREAEAEFHRQKQVGQGSRTSGVGTGRRQVELLLQGLNTFQHVDAVKMTSIREDFSDFEHVGKVVGARWLM